LPPFDDDDVVAAPVVVEMETDFGVLFDVFDPLAIERPDADFLAFLDEPYRG
jgi:hypothetical protein